METPHYRLFLGNITDGWGPVTLIKEQARQIHHFSVGIDDMQFGRLPYGRLPDSIADMIDLALAVYIADRFSTRRTAVPCHIEVHLPVRTFERYCQVDIQEALSEILYFMTRDHWHFIFTPRTGHGRMAERQSALFAPQADQPEVALWSGGLDALAGLYHRLRDTTSEHPFTLFGTGGNTFIHSVQSRVFHHLQAALTTSSISPTANRLRFVQVPLRVRGTKDLTPNPQARARGFIFLLLGAACALLEQQSTLHIYENGIGAINLPYRGSEIGIDHSRAVHPRTIRMMKHVVALLSGHPFTFKNPFEWYTKAQICTGLITDHVTDPIAFSITCDRRHRSIPMQCGRCSSCLLRRQALTFCGYTEPDERYLTTARPAEVNPAYHGLHLRAMLAQVRTLQPVLTQPYPWNALAQTFPDLATIADEVAGEDDLPINQVQDNLIHLYTHYSEEWDQVSSIVGRHLLSKNDLRTA